MHQVVRALVASSKDNDLNLLSAHCVLHAAAEGCAAHDDPPRATLAVAESIILNSIIFVSQCEIKEPLYCRVSRPKACSRGDSINLLSFAAMLEHAAAEGGQAAHEEPSLRWRYGGES